MIKDYILFNKSDILAVSETWLSDNIDSKLILINGYIVKRADRISRVGVIYFQQDTMQENRCVRSQRTPFC